MEKKIEATAPNCICGIDYFINNKKVTQREYEEAERLIQLNNYKG